MAMAWGRDRQQPFYMAIGLLAVLVVAVGFNTTYIAPMARRAFEAPVVVHIHGLLAFSWIMLFLSQCFWVRAGNTKLHMRLGVVGLPLALGILVSGILVARWAMERDLPTLGDLALSSVVGTFTSLTLFCILVGAGLLLRKRSDWHKRLLLLATVVVWWPAWFRWRHLFPAVPRPDVVFGVLIADVPILVAAVRDRVRYGAVHPVWKYVGPVVFAEQLFEALVFNTGPWPKIGRWLYDATG